MKIIKLLMAVVAIAFIFANCNYNFIVPIDVTPPDPDKPDTVDISFSQEILPIWNDGNFCTSCHTTGKTAPDLSTDNAYRAINNSRYINTGTPEESLIYTYTHPDTNTHMRKKYNSAQAAKILKWIQQGAKNN
jgi:hypothetical protein